ncbi:MAG: DUF4407 domain-containing protein, partial [Maritimibacter sp.]|nr:DUF4407 domain-containing protein [Maritimibacter sp.]
MSAVTGTSREQLGFVPDAEHRTVGLVGLTLLLVLAASAAGWWIALAIARGQAPLRHLPVVLLVGGLVYVVDRAMVRQHWVRYGRIQASVRGFYVPNPHGKWLALVIHWLLRVSVSLVLSLTTAGFVELALFETDIAAYRDGEARAANKPIYDAVQRDVAETTAAMRSDIDRLDAQIDALTRGSAGVVSAAQAAARQQIADLAAERTEQRTRIATLGQQIDCITRDRIAEKHGGVRCDNSLAVAGEGQRWEMAGEQLDYLRGERDRAEARIGEIDGDLARLQAQTDPVAAADQARLAELTDRRSQAQRVLSAFIAARGATVRDRVTADARFVPVLDGLVLRGEALDALA